MAVPTTRPDYRVYPIDTMPDVAELRNTANLLLQRLDKMLSEQTKFQEILMSSNDLLVNQIRLMNKRMTRLELWKYAQEDDLK